MRVLEKLFSMSPLLMTVFHTTLLTEGSVSSNFVNSVSLKPVMRTVVKETTDG
jgi:hypothetical protein